MSEIIERVARALWAATVVEPEGADRWEDAGAQMQSVYRDDARVAIAAMREPTEAMVDVALRKLFLITTKDNQDMVSRAYTAAIDEALK